MNDETLPVSLTRRALAAVGIGAAAASTPAIAAPFVTIDGAMERLR